jgi:hypothetical protein
MKNKLTDLNNHLFAQLERLSDEELSGEQIADEVKRADAVVAVADQIVRNADLQLKAVTILANHGARVSQHLTMLEERQPPEASRSADEQLVRPVRDDGRPGRSGSLSVSALQSQGRSMKGHPIRYSAEEMAWLEANRLMVISDYGRAFRERFGRADVSDVNLHSLRKRKGWKTGRTGCFENGAAPHNKGKPFPTAAQHPNCRKTHFTKGERRGVAVRLYKPVGTERVSKDGYRERKINDGMPLQSRWRAVHLIEWEAKNGPLPKGYALKCLDGNRGNADPANWEAIPEPCCRVLRAEIATGACWPTTMLRQRFDLSC